MRTIAVALFKYDELTESAQTRAREEMWDVNVFYDWWDYLYDDAAAIGVKIEGFTDREIDGKLTETVGEVARRIVANHGKACDTYHTAMAYYRHKHNGRPLDEDDFRRAILEDYRVMINREYEYRTSEEAVAESIMANDYEFTGDGKHA